MWTSPEGAAQTIESPCGLSEPPPPAWTHPSVDATDGEIGVGLTALIGTPYASRFCCWAGLSGRRYVFSVYQPSDCPAFCDAILLAAARDGAGHRRVVSVRHTGAFPEPIIARAQRELGAYGRSLEFHLHLLASSPGEREAALADLAIGPT